MLRSAPSTVEAAVLQTGQSPEIWMFTASNLLTFALGLVLTVIAFQAYRREGIRTFLLVSAGFAFVTIGTVIEMVYEFGVNDALETGLTAFGRELYLLRTVEGLFIALGLLLFVYSLREI